MQYQVGQISRVVVVRLNDGEDPIECIKEICIREKISSAVVYMIGGLKKGDFVVGPKQEQMPPEPEWRSLTESHEVVAIGTVFYNNENQPMVHLHGAFGKRDNVRVGCVRKNSEVFLVLEIIIIEITGTTARRLFDPATGMYLLSLQQQ